MKIKFDYRAILLISFLIKLFVILNLKNVDWEPDSFHHYNELITVYKNFPDNIGMGINVWTKPLYAYILGIPALMFKDLGFMVIQIINLSIFTYISYLIFKIINKIYNNIYIAYLGLILSLLDFIIFQSSISALTEPIFTLFLVQGFYFTLNNKYKLASAFYGLSVLGRIEGLFFLGVYNLWLVYKLGIKSKKEIFVNWVIGIVPAFLWNLAGFIQTGRMLYLFDRGYPVDSQIFFGTGEVYDYPIKLMLHTGLIFVLFLISIFFVYFKLDSVKKIKKTLAYKSEIILVQIFALGFLITQIITWKFGLFGSAGLIRYFVSVLPFMIISLASIFTYIKSNKRFWVVTLSVLQLIILLVHVNGFLFINKKWPKLEFNELREAGIWIRDNVDESQFVASERPEVIYYAERDLTNSSISLDVNLYNNKKGIYVWSKTWGSEETLEYLKDNAVKIQDFDGQLIVFNLK